MSKLMDKTSHPLRDTVAARSAVDCNCHSVERGTTAGYSYRQLPDFTTQFNIVNLFTIFLTDMSSNLNYCVLIYSLLVWCTVYLTPVNISLYIS